MKKILITGADGLVGSRFIELFPKKEMLLTPGLDILDVTKPETVKRVFVENDINQVVNFAAYTNVSEAEKERNNYDGNCWAINVKGLDTFLSVLPKDTHFIHISTDFVFPGNERDPGPCPEERQAEKDPDKLTWYGFTKAEGERMVKEKLGDRISIVRINNPVRANYEPKLDYLRKPLSLFDQGKLYPFFIDQQITITYIDELALLLNYLIEKKSSGIYHAASRDTTTPHEIVSYLIEKIRRKTHVVEKTTLRDFIAQGNDPRRYPKYGGLSVQDTEERTGVQFSSWREIVDKLINQGIGDL